MNFNDFIQFFHTYGYAVIFLSAFLESIIIASLFLPGSIIVLFGGYLAGQGESNVFLILVFALLGVLSGDMVTYFLGKSQWQKLIKHEKIAAYLVKQEQTACQYLERFGLPLIVYTHLLGYFRTFVCFAAGSARMPMKKYIFAISIASLVWGSVYVFTGYVFGLQGHDIKDVNKRLQFFLIGLVVILIVFKFIESKFQTYMKKHIENGKKQGNKDTCN